MERYAIAAIDIEGRSPMVSGFLMLKTYRPDVLAVAHQLQKKNRNCW
jgi:hypothetical protein